MLVLEANRVLAEEQLRGQDVIRESVALSGDASLSRFQFLVFTFVIALGLFLIILSANPPTFPGSIPGGILALLGISGGSYVTSKAVDANANKPPTPQVVIPPAPPAPAAAVVVNAAPDQDG